MARAPDGPEDRVFADIDGNTFHYTSVGDGPPIVFVHGLGGSGHVWHGVVQAMSQHHHCVTVDLRGHGRSQGRGKLSVDGWAKDVHKLIAALDKKGDKAEADRYRKILNDAFPEATE